MDTLQREIRRFSNRARAVVSQKFFKTGKGEYGEGDRFRGLDMKTVRQLAKSHRTMNDDGIGKLLRSKWHEDRMVGLLIIVSRYERAASDAEKCAAYEFFLAHREAANNWDLVDVTVPKVVGDFLFRHPEKRGALFELFSSENLWSRRMAVLSTWTFIRKGFFDEIFGLARASFGDRRDLIQKSVGWMLREVGKQNERALTGFLRENAHAMPRTMLRYSIEKFSPEMRKKFLSAKK